MPVSVHGLLRMQLASTQVRASTCAQHTHTHTFSCRLKNLGVEASNLKFVEDDNGPVILHRNPLGDSTTNASIVGADAKMTTSNGYKLGQGGSEYRGRLHIIDKVMLPIPEAGVPTLKGRPP
eukprot:492242-Pelagomonas_calceolata.AAC.2